MSRKVKNSVFDKIKANALLEMTGVNLLAKKSINRSMLHYTLEQNKKNKTRLENEKAIDEFIVRGGKVTILPCVENE